MAARHQLARQRVVAEAAPAVHPRGAGGDREDLHATAAGPNQSRGLDWSEPVTQRRRLKRARAEQELDDVAFVRLQPVELRRRHRAEVQPIDVHRVEQLPRGTPRCTVIAVHTSVGPIASSIFASGHSTTVTNGNMYSFFAIAASGDVAVDDGRQQVVGAALLDDARRRRDTSPSRR